MKTQTALMQICGGRHIETGSETDEQRAMNRETNIIITDERQKDGSNVFKEFLVSSAHEHEALTCKSSKKLAARMNDSHSKVVKLK